MSKIILSALTAMLITVSSANCSEFINKDARFDNTVDFGDVYGVVSFELKSPYTQQSVRKRSEEPHAGIGQCIRKR